MKIRLGGGLVRERNQRDLELTFGREVTLGEVLQEVASRVPSVGHYLNQVDELGRPVSLLIVKNGNWVRSGDLLRDEDSLEIHPPMAGGR